MIQEEQKVVPSDLRKRYPAVMALEIATQRVAEAPYTSGCRGKQTVPVGRDWENRLLKFSLSTYYSAKRTQC